MPNCRKCQQSFEIREEDTKFYEKFQVPHPLMCPECRLKHRLQFRNERTLYKRASSLSGQSIISIYHKDAPYQIYSAEEWWADKWDGLEYGRDFDFNRSFFEQFRELALKVPRIALFNVNPTNSDYCQQAYNNKNSYLCVVVEECEDCMYVSHSNKLRDCFDCTFLQNSELCYDCLDGEKLYSCVGCQSCQNSSNLYYCQDCIGCRNCIGCFGLRNKQFHIMNEPCNEADYYKKLEAVELNKYSKFLNCREFLLKTAKDLPHRLNRNLNIENCTGNYLINCKNCNLCYDSYELEDCAYCTWIFNSRDCMDVYGLGYGELVYNCLGVEKLNNSAFNTFVSDSSDAFYSDLCFYSMYLFGCVGLRNKKYCIFNKEYKPDEYEDLKRRIIEHMKATGEWGQFFPINLSPFCYNETAAYYQFPLSREEVERQGFLWKEEEEKAYNSAHSEIPDDIRDAEASMTENVFICESCSKNYKIMPGELAFYKRMNIPVPRKCSDCRYNERLSLRNPRDLWDRKCDKCGKEISTTYAEGNPLKIYCENCYLDGVD